MKKVYFILLPVLLIIASILFINFIKDEKIDTLTNNKSHDFEIQLNITMSMYKELSKSIFLEVINTKDNLELIKKAMDNSDNSLRLKLYKKLKPSYDRLQQLGLQQLHFHTKDGKSFLRFHKPESYGDNLMSRHSIAKITKSHSFIYGFEEGKVYSGFRYLYPLKFNGKYLGSVEISISLNGLKKRINELYPAYYAFMVKRDTFEKILFIKERDNYIVSPLNDNYLINQNYKINKSILSQRVIDTINSRVKNRIKSNLDNFDKFSIIEKYDNKYYCLCFIPIQNIAGEKVAYFIVYQEAPSVEFIYEDFYFNIALITFLIMGLTYIVYRRYLVSEELKRKNTIIASNNIKLQKAKKDLENDMEIIDKNVLMSKTDINGDITDITEAFAKVTGYTKEELIGQNHRILKDPETPNEFYEHMWKTISEGGKYEGELRNVRKDGTKYWARLVAVPIKNSKGKITGYSAIRENVTDKKKIEELSQVDPLTKVYNRIKLNKELPSLIAHSLLADEKLSLIIFDIDFFKKVNDTYGHLIGDNVLKELMNVMSKYVDNSMMLFRYGGEEFILVVKNMDLVETAHFCEHLRLSVQTHTFNDVGNITCSFGVTALKKGDNVHSMIKRADDALYQSKENGRNLVTTKL
jgi:diguanylate cyclase (GGDEF)-like protein/PAS domain S-box-containing protein